MIINYIMDSNIYFSRIISLLVIALVPFQIYSQGQDYIITYKGDTILGNIDRLAFRPEIKFITDKAFDMVGYEDQVVFIDENGKESTFACGEIMGFNDAGLFFESFYVPDLNKEGRNMVFSEKIVSGKANLYKVVKSVVRSTPTRETVNTVQELQYLAVAGKPTVRMSKSKKKLRELLSNYLSDDEITLAAINEKSFNKSRLQDILRDYNQRH